MEKSTGGTKKRCHDGLSHPNQNTIIINKMWEYFIRNGKRQSNSIDKNQNGLKYSKNDKSSTLPRKCTNNNVIYVY